MRKDTQTKWLTAGMLQGMLPKPFPQHKKQIRVFMRSNAKALGLIYKKGENVHGDRYYIRKDKLETYLKNLKIK